MVWLELAIVLIAIILGARYGGIGIGYFAGIGLFFLTFVLGVKPGTIPMDVILIIMAVISALAVLQLSGGVNYLLILAAKFLQKNPKHVVYLGPAVTYMLALLAGTGHTAYGVFPIIVEICKQEKIKPSLPLSLASVSSQIAITASPVSAAVVYLVSEMETKFGIGYLTLLSIWIPTTFCAIMLTAFIMNLFVDQNLENDPIYKEKLARGEISFKKIELDVSSVPSSAKTAVWLFLAGILAIVTYASAISPNVAWIKEVIVSRNDAIVILMLVVASGITFISKVNVDKILETSIFRSGMNACICVLGVAWLGDTFVAAHIGGIKDVASQFVNSYPWALPIAFFFASMLLYSQGATTKALIPAVLLLGVSPTVIIASFAAVSALFVLPTYPTLLAAVQMDDTGSTRIGKYAINHSFLAPGVLAIALSVLFGFLLAPLVI